FVYSFHFPDLLGASIYVLIFPGLKNLEKALRDPSLLVESELVPQQASQDATILLRRHGCDSDVTKQFIANLEAYARGIK
ncbi:MAG: hypothetical protein AB2804_01520, partial [Candidatus Thiodiazotropha endolucinida]